MIKHGAAPPSRVDIFLLTGFLGAGKTSLIRRVLQAPEMKGSAVIVNEVASVSIDDALIETRDGDILVLKNGCFCCRSRDDVIYALRNLYLRSRDGLTAGLNQVFIETSGLAVPGTIVQAILNDQWVSRHFTLRSVTAVLDGVNALSSLASHPEIAVQIAQADRVIISKADLTQESQISQISGRIALISPAIPIVVGSGGPDDIAFIVSPAIDSFKAGLSAASRDVVTPIHSDVTTASVTIDRSVPWGRIASAFDAIVERFGKGILRVKGLLAVEGANTPIVIHGVQSVFYPPSVLPSWPRGEREGRVVFIGFRTSADRIAEYFVLRLGAGSLDGEPAASRSPVYGRSTL